MEKEKIFREDLVEKRPPLYVYKARLGDKKVLLNEIIPYITTEKETISDFLTMVKEFAKTKYPDIANIIDVKKRGIRIFVLEQLKEGKHLRDFIKKEKPFGMIDSIKLTSSITKAVKKFHSAGIYGLGIEPENIIVDDVKNVTVTHPVFPIAEKFFRKTDKPEILNPRYLSPEQIRENVANEKGDQFNIGIILFEMLNLKYPFSINSYELLDFKKGIPYCLRFIIERLLEVDPSKRFGSLNDLLGELDVCEKDLKNQRIEKKKTEKIKTKEKKEEKKKKLGVAKEKKTREKVEKKKPIRVRKSLDKKIIGKKVKSKFFSHRNIMIGTAFILFLFLLTILLPKLIRKINPYKIANLTINKNIVETFDNKKKLLWRFKAGSDISFNLLTDIDADKRKEVILGTGFLLTNPKGEKIEGSDNARLYILDENKRLLFSKEIGMASIYPNGSSRWQIYDIISSDIDDDALCDFITLAMTDDNMDCLLFVRTQKNCISKFWHTGKISVVSIHNLPDNEKELICGGINMRMGKKPVIFGLSTKTFSDQSPPWGGNMKKKNSGVLWYRFLPGEGAVSKIEKQDSIILRVVTEMGVKRSYTREGFEIVKEDTTEEMIQERGKRYLECFKLFEEAKEYEKENKLDSALVSYNDAINMKIEDNAFNGILFYEKGMALLEKRRWLSSSYAFKNTVKDDPLFYEAFYKLGIVYSEMEKFKDAADSFKKAFMLSKKEIYFYRIIDCYTALGNYKIAKGLLSRFGRKAKDKGLFLITTAKLSREEGDFKSASYALERLIEMEPKNGFAKILLADIYADMNKNLEEADSLFAFSCKQDSSLFYENIETIAWILYRRSCFDEAFKKINKALEREERNKKFSVISRRKLPRIYYRKAIIAQTLGEKQAKEESIKKAVSSKFCKGYIKRQLNYLLASPK